MDKDLITRSGSLTESRRRFLEKSGASLVLATFGAAFLPHVPRLTMLIQQAHRRLREIQAPGLPSQDQSLSLIWPFRQHSTTLAIGC